MKILSNDYPTNMPDSEKVSQGGPANFACLFKKYITSNTNHTWIGLLYESVDSATTDCQKVYSSQRRSYYRLRVKKFIFKTIFSAGKKCNPEIVLEKPIKQIVKLINAQKPDVIFLNGFSMYNWMLLKAGELTNTPIVIQHAGIWTKELAITYKKFCSATGIKIMQEMEKDSTRIASHEIFLNEWSKKYYCRAVAKGNIKKTSIIPLPFDFISFKKLNTEINDKSFNFNKKYIHIGLIARWDKIKNHKAVLAIAKKAKNKKMPWIFHTVVNIPKTPRYKKEKKEYKKHIDVIPSLYRAGISQFCSAVDILILPSIFDVSPTVVLEAISSNTPIAISPNIGFADEFKIYGGKKWIINFTDTSNAIVLIKKLLGKKIPKSLQKKIKSMHESNDIFIKYLKIFNKVSLKHS